MGPKTRIGLLFGVVALAGSALAQPAQQKVTGPVAVYWMSAATQSGFGLPMGGGKPDMGAMMHAMMGGGGPQHNLTLQLGTSRKPQGEPEAEHLPPQGLGAGSPLPLVTPQPVAGPAAPEEPETPRMPREYQKPRGRMLIFWGCGEHAGPGQPLVIDFAKMSAGSMPPGLMAAMRGLSVTPMRPPSPTRDVTYGQWPNEQARTTVPGEGSLVGDHVVHGDYTPDINFSLSPEQDFLAPLELTTNARNPGGWVDLGWNAIPGAGGYLASAIGGGGGPGGDQVVLWISSEMQASAFSMPDYLNPEDLARLVASRALMGPDTTSCQVPQEVLDAAPQAMLQMVAYGHETDLVYPSRPRDPRVTWNKVWQVKVRYRSATGGMLGRPMPNMGGGRYGSSPDQRQQPQQKSGRGGMIKGLGGMMGLPGF